MSCETFPTLDFSNINGNQSFDSTNSDFDVFSAAKKQSKRRSSMAGNTTIEMNIENDENVSVSFVNSNSNSRQSKRQLAKAQMAHKAASSKDTKAKVLRSASVPTISSSMIKSVVKKGSAVVVKVKGSAPAPLRSLSSEDIELKRIAEEKKIRQEKIKSNKSAYEHTKLRSSSGSSMMIRSTKELTKPKTPTFKLTSRLGKRSIRAEEVATAKPEHNTSVSSASHGPTIAKPFNFETEKRAKLRGNDTFLGSVCPIIPAAEMEQSFMRDTRSHDVPDLDITRLTEPRTPNLLTKRRAESDMRNAGLKSRDVLQQEEMEAFQKNPFKANPVDKRIFEASGPIGIPRVATRPLTEFEPFNLRIDQRSTSRSSMLVAPEEQESHVFKALPLPTFSPRAISPRPPESHKALTIPVSPKLHGRDRASSAPAHRQKPHHSEVERQRAEELEAFKQSMSAANPYEPIRITQPKEFHFRTSARSRAKLSSSADMEQQYEAERQTKEFKARPAPKRRTVIKPAPSSKPLTETKEFALRSTSRHQVAQASFQKQKEEIALQEASVKRFR